MEDLSKTQFILLVLLISFVTSIGTGVITTSLLNIAPPAVTQTINHVVQQTVEKVVPQTQSASVVTKEVTVISDEDLVTGAIDKNTKSLVRVYSKQQWQTNPSLVSLGIMLTSDGLIVAHSFDTSQYSTVYPTIYTANLADGSTIQISPLPGTNNPALAFFRVNKEYLGSSNFSAAALEDSTPKLGQTVISMTGASRTIVGIGRVSDIVMDPNATSTVSIIKTDINEPDSSVGGPLVDLNGKVIGMRTSSDTSSEDAFIPSNIIEAGQSAAVAAESK